MSIKRIPGYFREEQNDTVLPRSQVRFSVWVFSLAIQSLNLAQRKIFRLFMVFYGFLYLSIFKCAKRRKRYWIRQFRINFVFESSIECMSRKYDWSVNQISFPSLLPFDIKKYSYSVLQSSETYVFGEKSTSWTKIIFNQTIIIMYKCFLKILIYKHRSC